MIPSSRREHTRLGRAFLARLGSRYGDSVQAASGVVRISRLGQSNVRKFLATNRILPINYNAKKPDPKARSLLPALRSVCSPCLDCSAFLVSSGRWLQEWTAALLQATGDEK